MHSFCFEIVGLILANKVIVRETQEMRLIFTVDNVGANFWNLTLLKISVKECA